MTTDEGIRAPERPLPGRKPFWIAVCIIAATSMTATTGIFLWKTWNGPSAAVLSWKPVQALSVLPPPERLAEWHFHLPVSARPELADWIIELQLAVERDSEHSIVFLVPAQKAEAFRQRIETSGALVKQFGEPEIPEGAAGARTTAYFE